MAQSKIDHVFYQTMYNQNNIINGGNLLGQIQTDMSVPTNGEASDDDTSGQVEENTGGNAVLPVFLMPNQNGTIPQDLAIVLVGIIVVLATILIIK